MKVILCVTRDMVTGDTTTSPQIFRNELEAERSWSNAIREASLDPKMSIPVNDLQLYKIANFDTESLAVEPDIKFLHNAQEFLIGKTAPVGEVSDGIHN